MRTLRPVPLLILTLLPLTLSGCGDLSYLARLGWHQGAISYHSVPVQDLLTDENVTSQIKYKVRLVQEIKRYGEENLGLKRTGSYSNFLETKGPVLYVVTACEKDRLQLRTWNFPLVGQVSYRGYFTRDDALEEKSRLESAGYDTYLQQAAAYSTLGWLKDPIFSSMTQWSDAALANLILHEMTHATLYFKGETDFNEQVATFIGNRGSVDFLTERFGPQSKEVEEALDYQKDDLVFSHWIEQACDRLSTFYGKNIPTEEKLRGREEIFRSLQAEFREVSTRLETHTYKNLEKVGLNNAVLLAHQRYVHRLDQFDLLYEALGKNLGKLIEVLKEVQRSGENPRSFLEKWSTDRGKDALVSQREQTLPPTKTIIRPQGRVSGLPSL
jgi:predicted aminopeptidase